MSDTITKTSLRDRATEARNQARQEEREMAQREYESQCKRLAKLVKKVLDVECEDLSFRQRTEYGAAVAKVEGISFALHLGDGADSLQLLSPCESCGEERSATIYSIGRLGELLERPNYFYHYCSRPVDPDDTAEGRLIAALRDLIGESREGGS